MCWRGEFKGLVGWLNQDNGIGTVRIALVAGVAVAILNFVAFSLAAAHYGGVPSTPLFNATPTEGPYLLGNHGDFSEVRYQVFTTLLWQSRSLVLTCPLGAICGWLLKRRGQIQPESPPG